MSDVTTNDALTLYTTSWCPFCTRLKKLLDEKEIGYTAVSYTHLTLPTIYSV